MKETKEIFEFQINSNMLKIEELKNKNSKLESDNVELELKTQRLIKAKELLTMLKHHKMESKREFILKIINSALDDVFDQGVKIDIEADSSASSNKINMKYHIVLYQNGIEISRNEKLLGNNGGGILSFISILFKILVGYIYSDNKFFLFDESISQVSPTYRPKVAKFLKDFCNEYNFTIVLISQTDDVDKFADTGYLLSANFDNNGIPVLKIDTILGTYPQDNYIYSKINNFQSIVELEFRYSGFVVVRGNNNIGKSASFRAIYSLLFNTFDSKDHPRKKTKRGTETMIEFGMVDKDIHKSIILKFKSTKVIYEFDGEQYVGKSLAFEKVKEKVESIGFKYVNLKETYKNFKGNLKDQTERLVVTTQYDGFYLVGNKTSETDKVFNFLFDSTIVANAISDAANDILDNTNKFNISNEKILDNKRQIIYYNLMYNLSILKFYKSAIDEYSEEVQLNIKYNIKLDKLNNILSSISKIIKMNIESKELKNNYLKINNYKNSSVYSKLTYYTKLINLHTTNQFIKSKIDFFKLIKHRDLIISVYNINNNKLSLLNKLISYRYYNNQINHHLSYHKYINDIKKIADKKSKMIKIINDLINKNYFIDIIKYQKHNIDNLNANKKIADKRSKMIKIINDLIKDASNILIIRNNINSFQSNNYSLSNLMNKKDINMNKINYYIKIINDLNHYGFFKSNLKILEDYNVKYNLLLNDKTKIGDDLHKLDHEYNIEKCDKCKGIGYV